MLYQPLQIFQPRFYWEAPAPKGLEKYIAYYWEIQTTHTGLNYQIIPDACIDLVIDCRERSQTYLSPSPLGPQQFILGSQQTWFGIRFHPGVLAGLLRVDISSLQFETLELGGVHSGLNQKLREALKGTDSFHERQHACNRLWQQLNLPKALHIHPQVEAAISLLLEPEGKPMLTSRLRSELAISERHLRRLFHQELGLSPKRFARILRVQHALCLMQDPIRAWQAKDLYFDQAHMIREIKGMVGMTPGQLQTSQHTQPLRNP